MKLWIRSQDENVLQKTNALFIANTDKNIFSIIDNVNMTKYGTYSTKERALEVLDEIQNFMLCNREYGYTANVYINELANCYIYEMPKE